MPSPGILSYISVLYITSYYIRIFDIRRVRGFGIGEGDYT